MSQPQQSPPPPPRPPTDGRFNDAYRQGFLDGHLAGWRDAVAREAAAERGAAGPGRSTAVPVHTVGLGKAPVPASVAVWPETRVPARISTPPVPAFPPARPVSSPPVTAQALPQGLPQGPPVWPRPGATGPQPPAHQVVLDPVAAAARKARRETQNINLTLYIASLLMVAAAALFVGSALPGAARVFGAWTVTALFYGTGLWLEASVRRLRPAAVAFVGTALAMIPFAGAATLTLGTTNLSGVWLATSIVGTLAYVVAAIRLRSRLVVYLSVAFLLSTAWSSVAVLGAALAWYFTALIVFSAVLSLTGRLLGRQEPGPDGRTSLYAKPLAGLGPWFTPVGLAGSLVFSLALSAADHAMVLLAGALSYAVMSGLTSGAVRRGNYVGLRLSVTVAAPFVGWLVGESAVWAVGAMTLALAVQAVAVASSRKPLTQWLDAVAWPMSDVYLSIPVVAGLSVLWSGSMDLAARHDGAWVWSPALPLVVALLAAMTAVPAFLPKGEWLPLPAVGAAVLCSPVLMAQDWLIVLAVALAYSVLRLATAKSAVVRRIMVVAARLLATAIVATALAAYVPAVPGKSEIIMASVAVIAAGQLLVDTFLSRFGGPNPVTAWSGTAWAVLGTALAAWLAMESAVVQFGGSVTIRDVAAMAATAAMACAAVAHSSVHLRSGGAYAPAELMAPVVLVVCAVNAGLVHHSAGASIGWALLGTYLLLMGLRMPGHPTHRWMYWRGARVVSLLLAVTLYQLWQEHVPTPHVGSSPVTLAMILLVALVPQLALLAAAQWRNTPARGLAVDCAATLGLAVVVSTVAAFTQILLGAADDGWTAAGALGLCSAGVALLAGAAALRPGAAGTTGWLAPGAMVALCILWMGDRNALQAGLAVLLISSAVLAARSVSRRLRGAHFLLARIAFTALVGVVVAEFVPDPAVVSLALSASLLLQLSVQRVAPGPVDESLLPHISLWLLLAAQAALPLGYVVAAGGLGQPGTGHRWVVVLELALLAGTSVLVQSRFAVRGASYLGIVSVVGGAAVMAPAVLPGVTALVLAGLSIAVIAWRCFYTPGTREMRWYWLVATMAFLVAASVVDTGAAPGIMAVVWLVAGLAFVVAAQLHGLPWLTLPGAWLVLVAAVSVRAQAIILTESAGVASLAAFAVVVGTLYFVRLALWNVAVPGPVQRWSITGVALAGGAAFSLAAMTDRPTIVLGAFAFTAVAALACLEVPSSVRRGTTDAAIVATALVWFWATSAFVDLGFFWLVQWSAVALGTLAVRRYISRQPDVGRGLLLASACLVSVGALVTVFSGDPVRQVITLLLFVALLAAGMSLDDRTFTIWGAIGVATAVLWYLRGFTFLLLAALALMLIGLAIWRLNRKNPHDAGVRQPLPGVNAAGVQPGPQAEHPQSPPPSQPVQVPPLAWAPQPVPGPHHQPPQVPPYVGGPPVPPPGQQSQPQQPQQPRIQYPPAPPQ
jgi:hypothetical protein